MPKKPNPSKKPKPRRSTTRPEEPTAAGGGSGATKPEDESIDVVATIKKVEYLGEVPQLAEQLAREGMIVTKVMPNSGVIFGSCAIGQIPALNSKVSKVVVERPVDATY
ncbi:MAG TPA: hypothetical protein VMZ71_05885 [Gemmataceae bacterium]|nr:hypothetical protein [Gemmataceae bacterium]